LLHGVCAKTVDVERGCAAATVETRDPVNNYPGRVRRKRVCGTGISGAVARLGHTQNSGATGGGLLRLPLLHGGVPDKGLAVERHGARDAAPSKPDDSHVVG